MNEARNYCDALFDCVWQILRTPARHVRLRLEGRPERLLLDVRNDQARFRHRSRIGIEIVRQA
jgi:hypothetical protein